jgi:molybdate transport system permease protein
MEIWVYGGGKLRKTMTETYLSPLWISLRTVVVATAITFFVGIAAARWMAHYEGKFKNVIDGIFILPLVLPPTAVGLGPLERMSYFPGRPP